VVGALRGRVAAPELEEEQIGDAADELIAEQAQK
jgi:hypothetical protein